MDVNELLSMERRDVVKQAFCLGLGIALGMTEKPLEASGGQLTVDLSKFEVVVFKFRGAEVRVPVRDVFQALKE